MGRLYRCDRCGKLIEKSELKKLSKPSPYFFRLGSKAIICYECAKSYRRWFEEPRKSEEYQKQIMKNLKNSVIKP